MIDREVAQVHAVDDVSITVGRGETLGLVGESGCGKSTLCRTVMQLIPDLGLGPLRGPGARRLSAPRVRPVRREMQMIFQDPYASLNPRKRVADRRDPLRLHGLYRGGS